MKKETVKKFFEFLEKKEKRENLEANLILSPESFPEGFIIKGSLDLRETPIESLPKGLEVEKHLWLSYNSHFRSLPEGLAIGGRLALTSTSIQSLPKGLKIGESLWVGSTPLSVKHTKEEIRKIIEDGGGYVKGEIYT